MARKWFTTRRTRHGSTATASFSLRATAPCSSTRGCTLRDSTFPWRRFPTSVSRTPRPLATLSGDGPLVSRQPLAHLARVSPTVLALRRLASSRRRPSTRMSTPSSTTTSSSSAAMAACKRASQTRPLPLLATSSLTTSSSCTIPMASLSTRWPSTRSRRMSRCASRPRAGRFWRSMAMTWRPSPSRTSTPRSRTTASRP
mmetsp:Transcript_8408/g.18417  ORF Transcript_8408/g.18417 Transcript_8408/m.18417 type:complete len:200 (-) Transcript_8408:1408-2007(-)